MGDLELKQKDASAIELLEQTATMEQPRAGERLHADSPASESILATPGRPPLAGRYTVLELLGQGGMGVVLAAYDSRLDRRVALKLLRHASRPSTPQLAARMVREAQAMARLNHPNVVAIYDAVTLEDSSIFIAMEMVEGQTLRHWCEQKPRTWREILVTYLAAGRGLAAAHSAGIVHRDFKPDNVLVGRDGRVRVTDFGLARAESSHSPETPPDASMAPLEGAWKSELTQPGTLLGTPMYMAPELLRGEPADARSDLFAFCVALYQALYGQPPFPATSLAELTRAQLDGRVSPPPAQSTVPAWVTRTVLRGLNADPRQRPASMMELISALEDDPDVRQRAWMRTALLATVIALLAGLPFLVRQTPAEPPCRGGARKLEQLWDASRQEALGKTFHATGKPNADESWTRTAQVLDTYARDWVSMHTEACEATRVRGEQSDEVLSLRMACLERRLQSLRALTDIYAHADAALVDQAAKAAHALPPLTGCANVEALRATVRPPEDAATHEKVEQLRVRLAEARALFDSGQFKPALERLQPLAGEAEALRYRPLQAEVLELRGALEEKAGDFPGSEASLRQAMWAAEAGRHDEVAASASARLVRSAMLQSHFEQGREWAGLARAVLERMGGDDRIEAFVTNALGAIFMREDKGPEAVELFRRVVALRQKVYPAEHPEVAAALNNLGASLVKTNRPDEARQVLAKAQAIYEKALGPNHPETSNALHNLGQLAFNAGDDPAAVDYYQRSLAARETGLGPEHPEVAMTLGSLGGAYCNLRQYTECLTVYERSLAIREKAFGPEHTDVAISLVSVGQALTDMGRKGEALEHFRRALRILESAPEHNALDLLYPLIGLGDALRTLGRRAEALAEYQRALGVAEKEVGKDSTEVATVLEELGGWYQEGGQHRQALQHYQRALAIQEKLLPSSHHPTLFGPLAGIGECQVALRAPAQAIAPLERALALGDSPRLAPERVAKARFLLARVLWDAEMEHERALALASRAYQEYVLAQRERQSAQVAGWLKAHGTLIEVTQSRAPRP